MTIEILLITLSPLYHSFHTKRQNVNSYLNSISSSTNLTLFHQLPQHLLQLRLRHPHHFLRIYHKHIIHLLRHWLEIPPQYLIHSPPHPVSPHRSSLYFFRHHHCHSCKSSLIWHKNQRHLCRPHCLPMPINIFHPTPRMKPILLTQHIIYIIKQNF